MVGPQIGGLRRRRRTAQAGGGGPLLPAGSKVMMLGHSYISNGHFTGTADGVNLPLTTFNNRLTGDAAWLKAADARFNLDAFADDAPPYKSPVIFGVSYRVNGSAQAFSGASFYDVTENPDPQYAGFAAYMIARAPAVICMTLGINDILGSHLTADTIRRANTLISAFLNAGIRVVCDTVWGINASRIPTGDPRLARIGELNTWLRAQVGRPNFHLNDVAAIVGEPRPNQSYWLQVDPDGLHPTERGAYASAQGKLAILRSLIAAGDHAPVSRNPAAGNLMPNASYAGTGGTLSNVTGVAANGLSIMRLTGTSAIAASKEPGDVAGYDRQVLTITPGGSATVENTTINQTANVTLSSLGIAPGDWLQALQYVELSPWDFWVQVTWQVLLGTSSATRWTQGIARGLNTTGAYRIVPEGGGFWMVSEPFEVGAADTHLRLAPTSGTMLSLRYMGNAVGTGTARISKPILRKAPNPKAVWNL